MAGSRRTVIGGVDTHHAAVIDTSGRILGSDEFDASEAGYRKLLAWLRRFGELDQVGVEGTGSFGAGLCRHHRRGVVESIRASRA